MTKEKSQPLTFFSKLNTWIEEKARGPHGEFVLALTALTESSVFIVPPDVVIAAILLYTPQRWIYISTLATVSSVVGGLIGYLIGFAFFETVGVYLVEMYGLTEEINRVGSSFSDYAFISIFLAAFTPIPYKVFTIAAGLFSINIPIFLLASTLGRGLRFFVVGVIVMKYGQYVLALTLRYFKIFTLVALILFICTFLIF